MILVDTNVFSEFARDVPDANVIDWYLRHEDDALLSVVVMFEALAGAERITNRGERRRILSVYEALFSRIARPAVVLDTKSARLGADLAGRSRRSGTQLFGADAMIAGIAAANRAALATRNAKDFKATGLTIIDPWNPA